MRQQRGGVRSSPATVLDKTGGPRAAGIAISPMPGGGADHGLQRLALFRGGAFRASAGTFLRRR